MSLFELADPSGSNTNRTFQVIPEYSQMSSPPFKIVVVRGIQQGEEYYITRRITRIGSESGCEFCVQGEGIPGHAASVDVGGEEVIVYNRGEIPFSLCGHEIPAQGSGVWKKGKDFTLGGGVLLRLETYSPKAVAAARRVEFEEASVSVSSEPAQSGTKVESTEKKGRSASKSNAGPIAFILACLVLVILMIVKKSAGDAIPVVAASEALTWEQVWTELNREDRVDAVEYDDLRRGFQHLYRLQNSPNSMNLPRWKSYVLQMLIANQSDQAEEQELVKRLRSFVTRL